MNEVMKMTRKVVTAAVVALTIAWSVSLSAFLAPLTAQAATGGSLVKASLPAVYYVGNDGKRYVFPNENTYKTWYSDFSGVQTITDAELASMPIGGNVTYKPGVKMVKITTDPKVYVVAADGTLRGIASEDVAAALYGANWNKQIDDIPDAFFTNYTVGADVNSASDFNPASVSAAALSINSDKGLGASGAAVSGTLSVSLDASQPMAGTIPKGATGVNVLKFDVHNGGSSTASLDSLTVHRSGAGAPADIANVYVYMGNDRVTTGRTVNTSTNDASFSGLNLSVAAGQTEVLWIAVDFAGAAAASDVNQFSLTSLMSGSNVASGLPLAGPSFTMSGAVAGSVTLTNSGTITNPKAGQLAAQVAQFTLQAGGNEDVSVQRIALYQAGSLGADKIANFALEQGGTTVATTPALNSQDLAVFVFSTPMTIAKGDSRVFQVYADINGTARAEDSLEFYIDQTTDVLAVGNTYGYGVAVNIAGTYDGAGCAVNPPAGFCSASVVNAGQLTITFNGPASKDVAANSKNVELLNFTMSAQSNLEVKELHLEVVGNNRLDDALNPGTPRLTNIQLIDTSTGGAVMGPKDVTQGTGFANGDATSDLDFNDVFDMTAGTARTFSVQTNVANTATIGALANVTTSLLVFGAGDIRNLDASVNLDPATDIVPDTTIAGNQINLEAPSLTVSAASTPVAQSYIKGTQAAPLMGISLTAGDGADVKVSEISVQGEISQGQGGFCNPAPGDTPNDTFKAGEANTACTSVADVTQTLQLWNGAAQVGSTKSPSTSSGTISTGGLATFDNLNLTVPAGQSITLVLTGNLSSALTAANLNVDTKFAVNADQVDALVAQGGVTATDTDGNTVNPTGEAVGAIMRVSNTGTIIVTKAPDDSDSQAGLVVGGSSNVVLGKFQFAAQHEELKLTKARINVATANTVSSVSLYDGSNLVGGPVSIGGDGNANFSGMSAFIVPKDGNKTLIVKGTMNTVGSSGATSGSDAKVTLCDGVSNGGGCGAGDANSFEMRGTSAGSSTDIVTTGAGDLAANSKIVRGTVPTVNLVALPSTTLVSGDNVALEFTVAADAANPVSLKSLTVDLNNGTAAGTLTSLNVATSDVRKIGGTGVDIPGTSDLSEIGAHGTACTTGMECTLAIQFQTEEIIPAGSSNTYQVRVHVSASQTNDSISAKLLGDGVTEYTGTIIADAYTPMVDVQNGGNHLSNFVWSDNSVGAHNSTLGGSSADWANGAFVQILPTDTQTISR
jgi:hypothetical protein